MKTFVTTSVILFVFFGLLTQDSNAQFRRGRSWLGVNITVATDPIGFGADFEYGVSDNVGIGGLLRYWGKSLSTGGGSIDWTVIMPQFIGSYHFMPNDKLDPYVGARLGYAIYSLQINNMYEGYTYSGSDSGSLFLTGVGGIRYFFSPMISGNGSLDFRIAGTDYFASSVGLVLGIDFTL